MRRRMIAALGIRKERNNETIHLHNLVRKSIVNSPIVERRCSTLVFFGAGWIF